MTTPMASSYRSRPPRRVIRYLALIAVCLPALAVSIATASPQLAGAATTCGGESPPAKPAGGTWTCTFDDEFDATTGDATALNTSKWAPQLTATSNFTTGPTGSQACYVNSSNAISVSGGALQLSVRKSATRFTCGSGARAFKTSYTAGMVSSIYGFTQTYGLFEVRAKLPAAVVKGLQETFWLYPANPLKYGAWPGSGEIDFAEFYSQYPTLDIPYVHYNYAKSTVSLATNTNIVTNSKCVIDAGQYNTYAVQWSPGTISIGYNGVPCLIDHYVPDHSLTEPAPFDQPFLVALTQGLGVSTNAFSPSTTPLPATTSVDYVRVWK